MEFKFTLNPRSRRDLQGIWSYIARDSEVTATEFCDSLLDKAESLRFLPYRNAPFPRRPNVRKVVHQTYVIFYEIHEERQEIEILRFWHSARSQHRLRLREDNTEYFTAAGAVS